MNLGKRIKARREELGIEQKELAAKIPGLKPSALSNLENRDSKSTSFARLIAMELRVHQKWLETGEGPKLVEEGEVAPVPEDDFKPTPREVKFIKDLRIILDDVRMEILAKLQEAADVAHQYEARFGSKRADDLSVIRAIKPAPRVEPKKSPQQQTKHQGKTKEQ
jgi:transcriptional regulator with XRE-family HTH domain